MIKKILSYTLLFVESILFFSVTLLLILRLTVLNTSYIERKFEKNDYYNKLYNEIKTEMSYYTNQSGFDDEILDDIFTADEVKTSVNKLVRNTYKGIKTEINTDKIKEKFDKKIEDYIKENNYEEVDDKEIETFVNKMVSIYNDEIKMMNYTDKAFSIVPKLINILDEVLIISALLLIALIIINFKIFKRKYFSVILYTSSLLLTYLNIYIRGHIDIKNLLIYSESITVIIKEIINNVFTITIIISIIYIIIGLILSLKKHRHKNHN